MKYSILFAFFALHSVVAAPPLAEVETSWPGVKLLIINAQRLDPGHVLLTIKVKADRSMAAPQLVASRPALPIPANASAEDIDSGKYEALPYTFVGSKLTDEATGKVFEALPMLPDAPFVGPNIALVNLKPGSSFQMAVYFTAPPPPPKNAEGVVPPQKVAIQFPKAAKPLTGFVLPPDVTKPAP
jgi:hypothetical protein